MVKKNYGIYKDNCIINVIGEQQYKQVHGYWLGECESDIVGCNILLDIIDKNFSGKKNMDKLKHYIEEKITRAKLRIYSSDRETLVEAEEHVIKAVPDLTARGSLTVEYNKDGSRKDLSQLFEMRKQLKKNLKGQLNYGYGNVEQIKSVSKMNNELLDTFIYKAIEHYSDEEFIALLSRSTEKEIKIIKTAIKQEEAELRSTTAFAVDCITNDTRLKMDATKQLLTKYDNCLRLKRIAKEKTINTSPHKK